MIEKLSGNLNKFSLGLFANQIGVEGGEILSKVLPKLVNLESLSLDHYFNNLTVAGSTAISNGIKGLT